MGVGDIGLGSPLCIVVRLAGETPKQLQRNPRMKYDRGVRSRLCTEGHSQRHSVDEVGKVCSLAMALVGCEVRSRRKAQARIQSPS